MRELVRSVFSLPKQRWCFRHLGCLKDHRGFENYASINYARKTFFMGRRLSRVGIPFALDPKIAVGSMEHAKAFAKNRATPLAMLIL